MSEDRNEEKSHLRATRSDRGFVHLPRVPSEYGGHVEVSESSAAEAPHVWLRTAAPANLNYPTSPHVETSLHLTVESAQALAEQLLFLVEHHYQTCDPDKRTARLTAV